MNGTPTRRGPGGFPATPQTGRTPGIRSPNGTSFTSPRPNVRAPIPQVPSPAKKTPTSGPLIPASVLDPAQQRLYVFGAYVLLWAMRSYDFYNLAIDETESFWQFLKWVFIDLVFIFGIPLLEIPWLEWGNLTAFLLYMIHIGLDAMLMFRIGVCTRQPPLWIAPANPSRYLSRPGRCRC
jgi:nucleoporin POM152